MLVAFGFMTTLIGVAIGPLAFSLTRTMMTQSLRADYLFNVHAPIGANPSLGLYPLHSDQIVIGATVAIAAVSVLTSLFVALYPSSQKLANRLALYSIGTAVVASGAMAQVADLGLLRSLARWKGLSDLASGATLATATLLMLIVIVWFERRAISTLGNLFQIDNPFGRFSLWGLRVPLPWGAFAVLSYLSDWWGGVIASAAVIAATLIDDLIHWPSLRYETLERPKMHEGLTAACIVALLLVGTSVWAFGSPALRLTPRALVIDRDAPALVPVSDLTIRIQEDTMPRIDMKWSEPE